MPTTDLFLMIHPPSGDRQEHGEGLQERVISDVPVSLARKIAEDFVRGYQSATVGRYILYQIGEEQDERLVPMDFGEVAAIGYARS